MSIDIAGVYLSLKVLRVYVFACAVCLPTLIQQMLLVFPSIFLYLFLMRDCEMWKPEVLICMKYVSNISAEL